MRFKQLQLFQLLDSARYPLDALLERLEPLAFKPCLPSMPSSIGWVSPLDEEGATLTRAANGYIMLCMQVEEKILPASVIRQTMDEKIKKIEALEDRKIRQQEKLTLKDEAVMTLLPKAFSKLTRVYGYIDIQNQWLVLGTTHGGKTEQFISLFKKSISEKIHSLELKKLSPIMTRWLQGKSNLTAFSIEKNCLLQDQNQQNRTIRCQQQDLFAPSIQSLIKDGCEAKQLALFWHDRVSFVLADDFSLRSIQFQEAVITQIKDIEAETKQQQFDADFLILTDVLSSLLKDLLMLFDFATTPVEIPDKVT
jgi:recombination associated protein RdgC